MDTIKQLSCSHKEHYPKKRLGIQSNTALAATFVQYNNTIFKRIRKNWGLGNTRLKTTAKAK